MVPSPVIAVILLFPTTDESRAAKRAGAHRAPTQRACSESLHTGSLREISRKGMKGIARTPAPPGSLKCFGPSHENKSCIQA